MPALAGLGIVWFVIVRAYRGRWWRTVTAGPVADTPFNRWQTAKGIAVVAILILAFLFTSWPREVVALAAAGVLLASGEMASREMLGLVDWHLLVLFAALFIVNAAFQQSGLLGGLDDVGHEHGSGHRPDSARVG